MLNVSGASTLFANNSANVDGGAVFLNGWDNSFRLGEALFSNNTASYGGALYAYSSKASR